MRVKRAFLLSLLLVAVVLSGAVFVGFQEYKQTLYAQNQQETEHAAAFVGSALEREITGLKRTVAVAADNPDLARHGTYAQRYALTRFRDRSGFAGASVIAANGTMTNIVSDVSPETRRELIGSDFSDRTYFRRALAGETYVSDPIRAESGHYIVTISTPITRRGRVVGTLNAAFHLSDGSFFPSFASTLEPDQSLTLSAADGETIYATGSAPADAFSHDVTVRQTGWTVALREDRAAVESTIRTVTMIQVASIVAVLAALFGFGYWLYRSNIRQVERLLDGFAALERERYGTEIDLDAAEEWRQIERGFNRVSRAVEQSRAESRARERALRRERDRFEALFEGVPEPIVSVELTDGGTFIRDANAAFEETFGYDAEEAIGRDINDLIVPATADVAADAERIDERAAQGEQLTREVRRETTDGVRDFLFRSAPIDGGSVSRQFGVYVDITDRNEYEKRLREQRDNLDVLNQVVRHDIRNDLQLVTAYADFLADALPEEGEGADDETRQNRRYVEKIRESASHAVELTETARNLADLLLTDDDESRPMNLRHVLLGEVEKLRSETTDADVTVEGSIPDVSVRGDDLLSSVFDNLLSNAVQHNDKRVAEVVVAATVDDERGVARVRVADNGPGVPDSRKDDVFGKGEKGLESSGTGLGLYLVRTLVDTYGGDVWIEDRGERRSADGQSESDDGDPDGAVFVVELPLAE